MTGKAHAHWRRWITADKSIQKNDYIGEKFYINSNRTLWGHLYQTPTIRNIGNHVVFGGAVGDGCIYIPCRTFEGLHKDSPMTVVLRVCDSDLKAAENNLGEIMINAKELVEKGGISAFQLSIHGCPGKSTIKVSARFEDETIECRHQDEYHKCSTLMSTEVLVLTLHSISGINLVDIPKRNVNLKEKSKNIHIEAWRSNELYLSRTNIDVAEPFFEKPLPKGTMTFSFSFSTSIDMPGSAIVKAGETSGIFYYITLKIHKRRGDSIVHLPVYILPLQHMPSLRLLAPEQWIGEPVPLSEQNSVCCGRKNTSDTVEISMSLDRIAYAPEERIRMDDSQIINNSRQNVQIRLVLKQWSTLLVPIAKTKACRKFVLYKSNCKPFKKFRLDDIRVHMPNVTPSIFDTKRQHEPVCITYSLALEVKAIGKKVSQELPILVCTFRPGKDSIAKARKLYPSKEPICNEIELEDFIPVETEVGISMSKDQESNVVNVVGLLSKQRDIKIPKKFSTNSESCQFFYHPKVLVTSLSDEYHNKKTRSKKSHLKHKHLSPVQKFTPPAESSSPHHLNDNGTLNYRYRKGFKFSLPFNVPFITSDAY
jgi:hypothetical protein